VPPFFEKLRHSLQKKADRVGVGALGFAVPGQDAQKTLSLVINRVDCFVFQSLPDPIEVGKITDAHAYPGAHLVRFSTPFANGYGERFEPRAFGGWIPRSFGELEKFGHSRIYDQVGGAFEKNMQLAQGSQSGGDPAIHRSCPGLVHGSAGREGHREISRENVTGLTIPAGGE